MKVTLEIIGLLVSAAALALLNAFVVVQMWGWFISPAFGIATPNVLQVLGALMMIDMVTYRYDPHRVGKSDSGMEFILSHALMSGFTLLSGWIVVTLFM